MTKNELAFQNLSGKGIEFGALHNPVTINQEDAAVLYADRLTKREAINSFPELEAEFESIVDTDFIVDLDKDNLSLIKENEFDFVIANHVIEHVVNPIRFLKQVSDNLKTGGKFFLTVPDKDFTHDKHRKLTRYRHVAAEYWLGTKSLSKSHIRDYLKHKLPVENVHPKTVAFFEANNLPLSYYHGNKIPLNPLSRKRLFNYHRDRSIHVHVWNRTTFDFFLRRSIDLFKLNLTIEQYLSPEVSHGEMIYLLEKTGA